MKTPAMPPLPWTVRGTQVRSGPAQVCTAVEYPEGHAADYIVHAANAYPLLVAALSTCVAHMQRIPDSKLHKGHVDAYSAAYGLLVAVGEESSITSKGTK